MCEDRENHQLAVALTSLINNVTKDEATCRHLNSLSVMSPLVLASEKLYTSVRTGYSKIEKGLNKNKLYKIKILDS